VSTIVFASLRSDHAAGTVKVAPAGVERFASDASCSEDYAASTMPLVTTAQEKTQTIDFRIFWETPAATADYL
jgi:hypothetical protein